MSARQDAMKLRAWAERAGVFSQGSNVLSADTLALTGEPVMFSAEAQAMLVRKPVTAIGYADSAAQGPRVFIYTRRKLTVAEMRSLRDDSQVSARLVFRAAQPFSVSGPSNAALLPVGLKEGRMTCGGSISVGNNREAGTLGALLGDADGVLYGLSCNHVTGGCSNARHGLPIVAPGILDVGAGVHSPVTIGRHIRALQFIPGDPSSIAACGNNLDAAAFLIDNPSAHSSSQGGIYDTPAAAAMPQDDLPVEKVGRSTGHTRGMIESRLVGAQRIDYRLTAYHSAEESSPFTGSVFFDPVYIVRGMDTRFAVEGDSGALVVAGRDEGQAVAVGIVIGGDRANGVTYMLPLPPVLKALGMTLVSAFN